jgi:hypothetical protein
VLQNLEKLIDEIIVATGARRPDFSTAAEGMEDELAEKALI